MGLWYGPWASSKGSELWALALTMVYTFAIMVLEGFRIGAYTTVDDGNLT